MPNIAAKLLKMLNTALKKVKKVLKREKYEKMHKILKHTISINIRALVISDEK